MARRHLAIFLKKEVAEKILSGQKQVEIRFSQDRVLPYGRIQKDDEIYLKISGGKILGDVEVDNVLFYDKLNCEIFRKIEEEYFSAVKMDKSFWQSKKNSRFATIIFLKNPKIFLTPIVYKKRDRRPWVVMEDNNAKHTNRY